MEQQKIIGAGITTALSSILATSTKFISNRRNAKIAASVKPMSQSVGKLYFITYSPDAVILAFLHNTASAFQSMEQSPIKVTNIHKPVVQIMH